MAAGGPAGAPPAALDAAGGDAGLLSGNSLLAARAASNAPIASLSAPDAGSSVIPKVSSLETAGDAATGFEG